ncbi:MAG: DUF7662 domain-containing protein [Thermoproteota archaeon]
MSRYAQLADFFRRQKGESVVLSFGEVERLLGSPLPASARKLRTWWTNDMTHSQAKYGWLHAGWMVDSVDFEAHVVRFRRLGEPPMASHGVGGEVGARIFAFEALAAEALSKRYGVKLYRNVRMKVPLEGGVEMERLFDLASEDGRVVGEVMYLSAGKTPTARFPAIFEHVWILEKIDADVKFIAFGGDVLVPKLWVEKYGVLVKGVKFYYVGEDGRVEELN